MLNQHRPDLRMVATALTLPNASPGGSAAQFSMSSYGIFPFQPSAYFSPQSHLCLAPGRVGIVTGYPLHDERVFDKKDDRAEFLEGL